LDDAAVYLIPIGGERFELYTEPQEEPAEARPEGAVARTLHGLHERWRRAVDAAQHPPQQRAVDGRFGRARRWLVCNIAESIDEQRTLWSLRRATSASFVYPADLTEATAAGIRRRLLADARTHHRWWLVANASGVAATAILILLPGPNVIGYYFLFRTVGHYLSWRGAAQALERITWRPRSEDAAAIRVIYTRR
jgi:Mitochondrial K+-H+ exchange-related